MLTKLILYIDNDSYELQDDDINNWSDIECTYKRSDYGGVIRSFMSKFEFVNEAYRLMMDLFDRDGYMSRARISLCLINDSWEYESVFESDLDFSTLKFDDYVLTINAIDASMASRIKANKNTKYEYTIGENIETAGLPYVFDRLNMKETVTYEITDGESQEDGSIIGVYHPSNNHRIYIGALNSEICVGGAVLHNDDQSYGDGYLFEALKDVVVTLDFSVNVNREVGCGRLQLMKNDNEVSILHSGVKADTPWLGGDYPNIDWIKDYIKSDPHLRNSWANDSWRGKWVCVDGMVWKVRTDSTGSNEWYNTGQSRAEYDSVESSGKVYIECKRGDRIWIRFDAETDTNFMIISSSFRFSWNNRGKPAKIECITPDHLAERLLASMGVYAEPFISNRDKRVRETLILAAESIRGIEGAKIYASFNDFCNWMETVFGYVYVLDEENGFIYFVHRTEIFKSSTPFDIPAVNDVEYSTVPSVLYSSLTIGYDKRDYEGVNGRDEFNFNSTYTTDYPYDGKTLTLKSPFRADSYGIEFLVEKRGAESTDNESDKDIFFVRGRQKGDYYATVRDVQILNTTTGTLINGEFSPMECAFANGEYISLMATSLKLSFASTEGNSNVIVDIFRVSDNLWIEDCEMLTAGEVKFTTDLQDLPEDINTMIRIRTPGYIYEGYIKEVSIKYARPESVQYTMMVKYKYRCS